MVALKDQQTISQFAQDSLAHTLQAEHEAWDQLTKSIEHDRVAQEESLRRINEAHKVRVPLRLKW